MARLAPLAALPGPTVEVFCHCAPDVLRARFAARSASRGDGYLDAERTAAELWNAEVGRTPAGVVWHGGKLLVANMGTDGIVVVDPASGAVERRVRTGRGAHQVFPSPDGRLLWVNNRVDGTTVALDANTLALVRSYRVPGGPDCIDFAPDGTLWIIEVKSSIEDFRTDRKWPDYRACCDRLSFAIPGHMPPEIMPLAMPASASATVISAIRRRSPSSTPATSVSISRRCAPSAPATAPATSSALML